MSGFLKKHSTELAVFCFGFVMFLAVYLMQGVFLGGQSMLLSDAGEQYYQHFYYLKQVFAGQKSLFYSFGAGGGSGMLPAIAWIVLSPLNLIFAIVPWSWIGGTMEFLCIFKVALAFTTMYILLKSEHPKMSNGLLMTFAACYGMCDWVVGYSYEIMWLDGLYLLPLIIMGLNRIVDGKKPWLYCVTLFLSIICSYYIGFQICIFSLLYFIARSNARIEDHAERVKAWVTFAMISLGAGVATFVIMFPTATSMMGGSRMGKSFAFVFGWEGFDQLSKLFWGAGEASVENSNYSFIYSGMISAVLCGLYFLNRKIAVQERKWMFALWAFMMFSVFFTPVYLIWHALTVPADLVGRFTYLVAFITVYLAAAEYANRGGTKTTDYLIVGGILAAICVAYFIFRPEFLSPISIVATFVGYTVYIGILIAGKRITRSLREILILSLTAVELLSNAFIILNAYDKENAAWQNNYYKTLADNTKVEEEGFYRIANGRAYTPNESIVTGTNSNTLFFSSVTSRILHFAHNCGFPDLFNAYWYSDDSTEIVDILMDNTYTITDRDRYLYEDVNTYTLYPGHMSKDQDMEGIKRYFQKNSLSFGLGTTAASADIAIDEETNPLQFQNEVFKAITGLNEDVLTEVPVEGSGWTYTYEADSKTEYYMYIRFDKERYYNITISQNGQVLREFDQHIAVVNNNYIHLKRGAGTVTVTIETNGTATLREPVRLYQMNESVLLEGAEILQSHAVRDLEVEDRGVIRASFEADPERKILYLAVPNEKGWTAYIDGEPAEIFTIYTGMMGIEVKPGPHELYMVYSTPNLKKGLIMTVIGILILVLYRFRGEQIREKAAAFYTQREPRINLILKLCGIVALLGYFAVCFVMGANRPYLMYVGAVFVAVFALIGYRERALIVKLIHRK